MKKILFFVAAFIAIISTSCSTDQEKVIIDHLKPYSSDGWVKVIDFKIDTIKYSDSLRVMTELVSQQCDYLETSIYYRSCAINYAFFDELQRRAYNELADDYTRKADSIQSVMDTIRIPSQKIIGVSVKYQTHNAYGKKVVNDCRLFTDTNFTCMYDDFREYIEAQ